MQEDHEYDSLPPAIIDALRELDGPAVLPDATRDADVLSGARRHLAKATRSRTQRNLRLFFAGTAGGAIAAAAVIGIVMLVGDPLGESGASSEMDMAMQQSVPAQSPPELLGDLNHSGGVDILDAYALARQIEQGRATADLDYNADGSVTQLDVDWIAGQAVALNQGEQG